ncbi:ras-related protein Rap-2c isoform X2 [Hippopotamus amphibius kiboko]|uniref:ras-related protein Rap-2c isoform X2 n=1 Tax=Hippopotamus amphibius kiboko TaxID=575201 RepID=UPI00259437F1|nr:ras-related protein Rap-2c isoform X2 [Hippopotamus amphibius kiboko]
MFGVLRVIRTATSGSSPQAGLGASETRRGFREVGVGLSAASAAGTAAAGGWAEKGRTLEVLGQALCQGRSPDPKPSRGVLPSRARPQRHPARPGEVGLSPPEVIPSSLGELGHLNQCVRETLPGVCCGGGGGVRLKKKKKEVGSPGVPAAAAAAGRPPPLPALRAAAQGRRCETEEPADGHGLGVTEPPGRPGGCGRQGYQADERSDCQSEEI